MSRSTPSIDEQKISRFSSKSEINTGWRKKLGALISKVSFLNRALTISKSDEEYTAIIC
jgi:hypothetical protein